MRAWLLGRGPIVEWLAPQCYSHTLSWLTACYGHSISALCIYFHRDLASKYSALNTRHCTLLPDHQFQKLKPHHSSNSPPSSPISTISQALLATVDSKVYMRQLFRALVDGQTPIVSVPVLPMTPARLVETHRRGRQ